MIEHDIKRGIGHFAIATLPAYFALLAAGYDGDRLQVPLIAGGAVAAALIWAIARFDGRRQQHSS